MKLTDKYVGRFFGMSLLWGLMVFPLAATFCYEIVQVGWVELFF